MVATSTSARRPTIGRVDYSAFSRRWSSVPLEDLFASNCDDVDELLAAYDQFKKIIYNLSIARDMQALYHRHAIALSFANYVMLTLLLNRKLEYMICLSSNRQLAPQFRDIETEIHFFVRLVSEAACASQATKEDMKFSAAQAIIHCLLYYRIGDYHMALFKHKEINESTGDIRPTRNLLVALGAYAFALYSVCEGAARQNTAIVPDARPVIEVIEALLAAELQTLVERGLEIPNIVKEFKRLCLDEVLPFRLLYADDCRARAEFDNWLAACGQSGATLSGNFIVDNVRQRSKDVCKIRRLLVTGRQAAHSLFGYGAVAFRPRMLRRLVLLVNRNPEAMRQLLKTLFRDANAYEIPPAVDACGRHDALTGVNQITRSDVGRFFRVLTNNCSLAWYNNTVHTRDLEPPAGSALDSRLAVVTFPYLLHRDVRPSDECMWAAIQKVSANVKLSTTEHRTLIEYLTKLSTLTAADDVDWQHSESENKAEVAQSETLQDGPLHDEQHDEEQKLDASAEPCPNESRILAAECLTKLSTLPTADNTRGEHEAENDKSETPKDVPSHDGEYDEDEAELILQYCSDIETFNLQFDCISF